MNARLTTDQIADADQLAAGSRDENRLLRLAVLASDATVGEAQTLANFIAYLSADKTPQMMAALLVMALRDQAGYAP